MADPTAMVQWKELEHLARERYPDLPFPEAYLRLHEDVFIKFPKEFAKVIKPYLLQLIDQLPDMGVAVGTYKNSAPLISASLIAKILEEFVSSLPAAPRLKGQNVTADSVAGIGSSQHSAQVPISGNGPSSANLHGSAAVEETPVLKLINGISVVNHSLLDRVEYYASWIQAAAITNAMQTSKQVKALNKISENTGKVAEELYKQNCFKTQGGDGPDGPARASYDFIQYKIEENTEGDHRYFVYHPDTDWVPSLKRLIRANPLPPTFCAIFHDLELACQRLRDFRGDLKAESEYGKDVVFHLLLPGWSHISFAEPLHFPSALQPFRIHGLIHDQRPYWTFNLPCAQQGLLDGVGNIYDPHTWNSKAYKGAIATAVVVAPGGLFGAAALGSATVGALGLTGGLAGLVFVPMLLGLGPTSIFAVAPAVSDAVYNSLREEPRILGSQDMLYTRNKW